MHWIIAKAREFQKNIYFCFIDFAKGFDCADHSKLENSERGGNTRALYLLPEKSVCKSRSNRTVHGTTDYFHIAKGVCQGCILSPCLFSLYAEYIMWNAELDEAQSGIKIAGRNISNLRYAAVTTLITELKNKQPLGQSARGEWKSWLKTLCGRGRGWGDLGK